MNKSNDRATDLKQSWITVHRPNSQNSEFIPIGNYGLKMKSIFVLLLSPDVQYLVIVTRQYEYKFQLL